MCTIKKCFKWFKVVLKTEKNSIHCMPFLNYIKFFGLAVIMMSHKTVLPSDEENLRIKWISIEKKNTVRKNAALKYFKDQIMQQIPDDVNASNPLCEVTGDQKVPRFDNIKNKKDRWVNNTTFDKLTQEHWQDIAEYVQNNMLNQSNEQLKQLLVNNNQCDFILALEKISLNQHNDNSIMWHFFCRLESISKMIKLEPVYLQAKKTIDFRDYFLWPKWPWLVYRYFFKSSACDDAMFKKFIQACYDFDKEKNISFGDLHEPRMLESFSDFDQLDNKKYLTEVFLLSNIKIDHIKSLINFFMNSHFCIIENLIQNNNTIDFIACLNRLSCLYVLQKTNIEKKLEKDDFNKIKNECNLMVENIKIVDDCVHIDIDTNMNLDKIQSQKWELFYTGVLTLFLLYYGGKKLCAYSK